MENKYRYLQNEIKNLTKRTQMAHTQNKNSNNHTNKQLGIINLTNKSLTKRKTNILSLGPQ